MGWSRKSFSARHQQECGHDCCKAQGAGLFPDESGLQPSSEQDGFGVSRQVAFQGTSLDLDAPRNSHRVGDFIF
jgi:hypothetical protein